jgi:hypothetical protein
MCPGAAAATGFHTGEGGLSSTRPFASDNQQAVDDENQGARATEGARWPAGMRTTGLIWKAGGSLDAK